MNVTRRELQRGVFQRFLGSRLIYITRFSPSFHENIYKCRCSPATSGSFLLSEGWMAPQGTSGLHQGLGTALKEPRQLAPQGGLWLTAPCLRCRSRTPAEPSNPQEWSSSSPSHARLQGQGAQAVGRKYTDVRPTTSLHASAQFL